MIRVAIFADTLERARSFAELLAEEERLEIVETRAGVGAGNVGPGSASMADVILALGIRSPERFAEHPAVVLVTGERPRQNAFARAVRAWLPEHAAPGEIAAAIVAAAQDLTALTQTQVREWLRWASAVEENDGSAVAEALTPREQEVLRMIADGLANKEIAARLHISDHTAKFHVAQILAKLRAASRAEAVTIGVKRGLLPV